MYRVMPTMPVSTMRANAATILGQIQDSPVVLTQNGREAGVLVHPRAWNDVMRVYEEWMRSQPALDPESLLTWEEFEQNLSEERVPDDVGEASYA